MTESHLKACMACARHVRVSEAACPFCGVELSAELRASPAPVPPSARLSRAALFALGTGTLALTSVFAIDCTTSVQPVYGAAAVPPYGQVPFPDGGEGPQDSARGAPDVRVGSIDASDSSAEDTGLDAKSDVAAPDSPSDASDASDAGDAD